MVFNQAMNVRLCLRTVILKILYPFIQGSDYPSNRLVHLYQMVVHLSTISNTYPLPPYAQVNVELKIDPTKNLINIHLTNGEHFSSHPAFDEQAEYFIHIQILNNKILKKFHDAWKKRRSSLQLNTWKKQQEKTTKFDIIIHLTFIVFFLENYHEHQMIH